MPREVITAIIVLAIIILAKILWEVIWLFVYKAESKNFAEKPFVCPNCGERFYTKWYNLYFKRLSLTLSDKAKLKCPKCGEKDMCRRMDEAE